MSLERVNRQDMGLSRGIFPDTMATQYESGKNSPIIPRCLTFTLPHTGQKMPHTAKEREPKCVSFLVASFGHFNSAVLRPQAPTGTQKSFLTLVFSQLL